MAHNPGLPPTLLNQIIETLLLCPESASDIRWRGQFITDCLVIYQDEIPSAPARKGRVETTIDFLDGRVPALLEDRQVPVTKYPLLCLLEYLLSKNPDPYPLHGKLKNCTDQLRKHYGEIKRNSQKPPKPKSVPSKPSNKKLPTNNSSGWISDAGDPGRTHRLEVSPEMPGRIRPPSLDIRRQANPGTMPILPTEAHARILKCAASVALVEVTRFQDGQPLSGPAASGTAWMIAPGLAITCWHVLVARSEREKQPAAADLKAQIASVRLRFDFKTYGTGCEYGIEPEVCSPRDEDILDYALLKVKDRMDHLLSKYGYLPWDCEMPYVSGKELYSIQHPLGHEQKDSPGWLAGEVAQGSDRFLHTIPTSEGSSGAPVMNVATWQVCGVHCGEQMVDHYNLALKIAAVRDDIQRRAPRLFEQIQKAQQKLQKM